MNPEAAMFTREQTAFLERHGFDAATFARLRQRIKDGTLGLAGNRESGRIEPPPAGVVRALPEPGSPEHERAVAAGRDAIRRGELGIVVLNGGMATRFGGVVKGVVDVLPGRSFLHLKVLDARRAAESCGGRIRVHVLDSFATDAATREHFAQHKDFGLAAGDLRFLLQFVSARLTREGELFRDENGQPSWYAPGHGDFSEAMRRSGALQEFMAGGGKYLLLSNVDNLGARVAPEVLGLHILGGQDATVEVAPKWPGDQGGAPALVDGVLQVVEGFRFPTDFDQDQIPVFNCNTFTFTARSIDRPFDLQWFHVEKKVNNRVAVQAEHLVGELTRFLSCQYLRVERTGERNRFYPIKTPEDLQTGRAEIARLFRIQA